MTADPPAAPRLQLLGTPALVDAAGQRRIELSARDAALLALLAHDGPLPRVHLAALLWPDSEPRQALISLRQRLFRMKRALGQDVACGDAVLQLHPELAHDLSEDGVLLGEYSFDADDALGRWVQAARAARQHRHGAALAARADLLEAEGRWLEALACAEQLLLADPAGEPAYRRVMRLHYLRGEPTLALAVWERCRAALRAEVAAEPGAQTLAVAALARRALAAAAAPAAAAPLPLMLRRPPRLVGRDAAARTLAAAWQQGVAALVVGEAGLGKSRLLQAHAGRHAGVLHGGARAGDAQLPWALLGRLLDTGLPLLRAGGAALPPAIEHAVAALQPGRTSRLAATAWRQAAWALFDGVAGLVVDDLQFADAASLELLLAWVLEPPGAPRRCLLATRTATACAALLEAGARISVVTLAPLTEADVGELLDDLALPDTGRAHAAALRRHSGGNPLFLLETLAAGWPRASADVAAVPPSIGALMQARLEALSPQARRLAQLAALAGQDLSVALAAQVLGGHALDLAPAWQALEAAHLVDERGFPHDLIRESVLATVPQPIARELHRQIAVAGAALGMPSARIGDHARAAHHWALASSAYAQAADGADALGTPALQLELLDAAAAAALAGTDAEALFALRLRALAPALAVAPLAALQARVQQLHDSATRPLARAQAWLAQARVQAHATDWAAVSEAAAQARALVAVVAGGGTGRDDGSSAVAFHAACLHAAGLARCGDSAAAIALLEPWRAYAEQGGTADALLDYWSIRGYVLEAADRRRDAVPALEHAVALAERKGDGTEAMIAAANLAALHSHLGRIDVALQWAERAEAWHARLGEASGVVTAVSRMNLGAMLQRQGRFDAALQAFEQASGVFEAAGADAWLAVARHHLAQTWLLLGQPARVPALLPPLSDAARKTGVRRAIVEARLAAALHDVPPPQAAEALQALLRALPEAEPRINRLALQLALAALEPDAAAALQRSRGVAREARRHQLDSAVLHARLRVADALRRLGRQRQALRLARALQRQHEGGVLPFDLSTPELWWLLYRVYADAGAAADAATALERGRRWLQQVAAEHVAPALRAAFLERQPVHRRLLLAAARPPP